MIHGGRTLHGREFSDLLPWYLNGTLSPMERRELEDHLPACAACREELLQERRIYEAMSADPEIEYMPARLFARLQARLDGRASAQVRTRPARHRPFARRAIAAFIAVAIAAALIGFAPREPQSAAGYYTVTNPAPPAAREVIRAVFSPDITLLDLQALLDEAQLQIIGGPTEAGVYSLAATSTRPVSSSLALLRRHPAVRFAESTRRGMPR